MGRPLKIKAPKAARTPKAATPKSTTPKAARSGSSFWESSYSAVQKRFFFFDRLTGQSTWAKPQGAPSPKAAATAEERTRAREERAAIDSEMRQASKLLPRGWAAAWDTAHERMYYYNARTGERSWHPPSMDKEVTKTDAEILFDSAVRDAVATWSIAIAPPCKKQPEARDPILSRIPWDAGVFSIRMAEARHGRLSDSLVQGLLQEVCENNGRLLAPPYITPEEYWEWRVKLERAGARDTHREWAARVERARMRPGLLDVPRSLRVNYDDCCSFLRQQPQEATAMSKVVFWQLGQRGQPRGGADAQTPQSFADVLRFLASTSHGAGGVVGVSPSTGAAPAGWHVGKEANAGSYAGGHEGVEADLCRQIPALWPSLMRGVAAFGDDHGRDWRELPGETDHPVLFPYGPSTCVAEGRRMGYSDGILTPGVEIARGPEASGYPLLGQADRVAVDILSVAPPVRGRDLDASHLVMGSILTMFAAPKMQDPSKAILVLPAWGCGPSWGNAAKDIASMFAWAIKREVSLPRNGGRAQLGSLYREIHFVFDPVEQPEDDHARQPTELRTFQKVFRSAGIAYSGGQSKPSSVKVSQPSPDCPPTDR